MATNNKIRTKTEIELDSFEISVCKNKKDQPFLNVFHFEGNNFTEQKLGKLFGVIQVFDSSKNSEYLPNLLAQVIRKEYYRDPKRTLDQCFEAALHKANLALTDLAQHEIIEWMGKLNAVVGVIEKNAFIFTQVLGGRILLIRSKLITDVTRGLDDGEGIGHPIKTFSNISSGKIQASDKIIFATETAFDALKWEELKRHCKVFNNNELDNIFRSTLETEGDQVGAVVVNVKERIIQPLPAITPVKKEDVNFFGSRLDGVKKQKEKLPVAAAPAPLSLEKEAEVKKPEAIAPLTDAPENKPTPLSPFESQPELFIKESEEGKTPFSPSIDDKPAYVDKIRSFFSDVKEKIPANFSVDKESPLEEKFPATPEPIFLSEEEEPASFAEKNSFVSKVSSSLSTAGRKFLSLTKTVSARVVAFIKKRKNIASKLKEKSSSARNSPLWTSLGEKAQSIGKNSLYKVKSFRTTGTAPFPSEKLAPANQQLKNIASTAFSFFSNAIKLISLMPKKKKLVATAIIVAIIALFSGIFSFWGKNDEKTNANQSPAAPTEEKKSIREIALDSPGSEEVADLKSLVSIEARVLKVVPLKDELFILAENDKFYRYTPQSNKLSQIEVPDNHKNIISIAAMPQLQLIFLINDKTVLSYSSVVNKFEENGIRLPDNLQLAGADTYLTYLYLLDKNSNQIYQYPRAAGGFGERKTWFKAEENLSDASSMAIDGSIFISYSDGKIKKFFQREEDQKFSLEAVSPDVKPHRLQIVNEGEKVYILDIEYGRIVQLQRDGKIEKQYWNEALTGAKDFWVKDKDKTAYFIDSNNQLAKLRWQ